MKILLLTTHLNLGGIGIYLLCLAEGLVQRGHQVWVASSGGDLVTAVQSCGAQHLQLDIKTKSVISIKVLRAVKQVTKVVQEQQIEIIHGHTRVTQVVAHLVARRLGLPYVTTCHGFFKPRIFRRIFPCWGNYCIAISEAVRSHLVHDLGVRKENIAVVHNGVKLAKFNPDKFSPEQKLRFRQDYGLHAQAPVIGSIARLSSVKGQSFLIAAMKRIIKVNPSVQLLLVGDGPEMEKLQAQVKQLRLDEHVFFAPATLDTSVPLSIIDIFVFPSILEGLGLAIIEAQAMALPVVASDVGGIYTLVKDKQNGFLVQAKDSQGIAQAILKLLKDEKLRTEFGRRAQQQVKAQFSLKQMCSGVEKVYQKALGQ